MRLGAADNLNLWIAYLATRTNAEEGKNSRKEAQK